MKHQFKEIETPRMVLKNIGEAQLKDMFELRSDPELMKYIPRPLCQNEEDAMALIRKVRMANDRGENINWAMTLKGSEEMFGFIGFARFHPEHFRAEVGYMIKKSHHGQGYVREALEPIFDFAFNEMGMHSVEAVIDPDNKASEKILNHFGFEKEAHFKENIFFDGRFLDSVHYTLFKKHWKTENPL